MDLINKGVINSINNSIVIHILLLRWIPDVLKLLIRISAILVSWYFDKSILWCIFHYLFAFWYLLYSVLLQRFNNGGLINIFNYYF